CYVWRRSICSHWLDVDPSGALKFSIGRFGSCWAVTPPKPIIAKRSSSLFEVYRSKTGSIYLSFNISSGLYSLFLISASTPKRPFSILLALSCFLKNDLILFFELLDLTSFSQSRLGPYDCLLVLISTISPVSRVWSIVTILPFTLAPIIWLPTSACT